MIRLAAALAILLGACSAPSPDVAITETEPRPDAQPTPWAAQPVVTTTTSEPVRVRAAAVTTTPPPPPLPDGAIPQLIWLHFGDHGAHAIRVAVCESSLDQTAKNGVHIGLFQLSGTYHKPRAARLGFEWHRMYEAEPNIIVAADLWREQGWVPWEDSRHCWGAA